MNDTQTHKKRIMVKPLILLYIMVIFGAFVAGVYKGSHPGKHLEITCPQVNICKALQQANPNYEVIYYGR